MSLNLVEEIIRIKQSLNSLIGEIKIFGGNNIPTGWLLCDGSEVLKSTYPKLYKAIGDSWGTPTNPDCFVLPNMCGKVPAGYDPNDTDTSESFALGSYGGARGAWYHNHSQVAHNHYAGVYTVADRFGSGTRDAAGAYSGYGSAIYTNSQTPAINNNGSTNNQLPVDKANMPPYAVVKYIIRAY